VQTSPAYEITKQRSNQDYLVVVGAGVMGTSIATTALGHGVSVILIDTDAKQLDRASRQIATQLRHGRLLSKLPFDQPVGQLAIDTQFALTGGVIAVIEAITENRDLKCEVLRQAEEQVDPTTPIISNTSGIPIDELASILARPESLVGAHFMNPAYLIKMVEVVRGPRTAPTTINAVDTLLKRLARQMIVVEDSPGFVTSRLLHPMLNDAARIVEEGVATVESIDSLIVECLGHSVGPLRTADLIGIDNLVDSLDSLYERTGHERYRPCSLLVDKVKKGHLGRKTGCGFYEYGEGVE
jgi:methoxymalonate biosynthesis protein